MLGRNSYEPEELENARATVKKQLADWRSSGAGGGLETTYFNGLVLALDRPFVHRIRKMTGKDTNPLSEVELVVDSLIGNGGRSRCNATREGLRARLVFPEQMLELIQAQASGYARDWHAVGRMEQLALREMGRATVQIDTVEKQLLFNTQRIIRQIPTGWDDRQQEFADQWMRKLRAIRPPWRE